MSAPDDRRAPPDEPTLPLGPVAWVFAALLVGPLAAYWTARLLRRAAAAAARTLAE